MILVCILIPRFFSLTGNPPNMTVFYHKILKKANRNFKTDKLTPTFIFSGKRRGVLLYYTLSTFLKTDLSSIEKNETIPKAEK